MYKAERNIIPVKRFREGTLAWQRDALRAFDQGRARFAYLVCHRRARKTTLALNLMIRESLAHPRRMYRYVAPTQTEARAIAWDDPNMLFSYLPDKNVFPWQANSQRLEIKFQNQSILKLEGADKISQSHRGKASAGVVFDEWSWHADPTVWTAVFRPMIAESSDRWAWFLFTPNGQNHAYDDYKRAVKAAEPDVYTALLKASESGIIPTAELRRAQKEMPAYLFDQEFGCSFLAAEETVLIQPYMIEQLETIHHGWPAVHEIIACDPAFGGNECVLYAMRNTEIIDELYMHSEITGEIVGALQTMGAKLKIHNYIIDSIGYGKGVFDNMTADPRNNVQEFDSRRKVESLPGAYARFKNLRAQAWWYAYDEIKAGRVAYPQDTTLRKQLCTPHYKMRNGVLIMEKKDDIKKRLGSSPDRAEAWIMGLYGTQYVGAGSEGVERNPRIPAVARAGPMAA